MYQPTSQNSSIDIQVDAQLVRICASLGNWRENNDSLSITRRLVALPRHGAQAMDQASQDGIDHMNCNQLVMLRPVLRTPCSLI